MTKPKAAAKPAAAAKPKAAASDACPRSIGDGLHHWIDEVHGDGPIRTTVQRCQLCGRKVTLGRQEV